MQTSESLLRSRKRGILSSLALSRLSLESHLCRIYWEVSGYFSSPCDPHFTLLCLLKRKHTDGTAVKFVCLSLAFTGPAMTHTPLLEALEPGSWTTKSTFFTKENINVRDRLPAMLDWPTENDTFGGKCFRYKVLTHFVQQNDFCFSHSPTGREIKASTSYVGTVGQGWIFFRTQHDKE